MPLSTKRLSVRDGPSKMSWMATGKRSIQRRIASRRSSTKFSRSCAFRARFLLHGGIRFMTEPLLISAGLQFDFARLTSSSARCCSRRQNCCCSKSQSAAFCRAMLIEVRARCVVAKQGQCGIPVLERVER